MNLTQDQINSLLLGLFAASGPLAKLGAALFPTGGPTVEALLDLLSLLTPLISGGIYAYMKRPAAVVRSAGALDGVTVTVSREAPAGAQKAMIAKAPGVTRAPS